MCEGCIVKEGWLKFNFFHESFPCWKTELDWFHKILSYDNTKPIFFYGFEAVYNVFFFAKFKMAPVAIISFVSMYAPRLINNKLKTNYIHTHTNQYKILQTNTNKYNTHQNSTNRYNINLSHEETIWLLKIRERPCKTYKPIQYNNNNK